MSKLREDPYNAMLWVTFADHSMEVVHAGDLIDEIFSNNSIKLFLLVSCVGLSIFIGKLSQAMLIPVVIIEVCIES